jgi:hypothetical protein
MTARAKSSDPEIFCDFNGRMTERGYLPTNGTVQDLTALGLTLENAVGRRFVFVSGDADEHNNPDDIMHNGTVIQDPKFGFLLEADDTGFYWRSELRRYIRVSWRHDAADEPIELWSELDGARYETRKLEIYRDGRVGYADAAQEIEGTVLSDLPLPALAEIGSDHQFEPQEISRAEFENLWREQSKKVS